MSEREIDRERVSVDMIKVNVFVCTSVPHKLLTQHF